MATLDPRDFVQVRTVRHLPSAELESQLQAAYGQHEIGDAAALTVAAQWQASGSVGSVLASFASGCLVSRASLLDDIAATRRQAGPWIAPSDARALDQLATFVIRHGGEVPA